MQKYIAFSFQQDFLFIFLIEMPKLHVYIWFENPWPIDGFSVYLNENAMNISGISTSIQFRPRISKFYKIVHTYFINFVFYHWFMKIFFKKKKEKNAFHLRFDLGSPWWKSDEHTLYHAAISDHLNWAF